MNPTATNPASCAFASSEPVLAPRRAHPEAFLHDCDSENTYLHVHVDLTNLPVRKPVEVVATLLRDGFQRLASQLHLRVIERRESSNSPTRPTYACADNQARKVLFGGAVLQATHTMELWQRYDSEPGVLGVRLHFHHPITTEAVDDVGEKKRTRFVRLFNAAWVKLLFAHGLLTRSPFGVDNEGELVIVDSETIDEVQQYQQQQIKNQHTYATNSSDTFSRKRVRDPSDDDNSSDDSSSGSSSGSDDENEGEWLAPAAVATSKSSSSWEDIMTRIGQIGWHMPMEANAQPQRSALKRTTISSKTSRRSVSFAPTRRFVCIPFSVEERAARMCVGDTPTFGNGFMKPLRSTRTGDVVWMDAELDIVRGKRARVVDYVTI